MKKEIIYRHGDLCLRKVEQLSEGLTEAKTNVLMEGKTASHKFKNGKVYFKEVDEYVYGYFVSNKDTVLMHKDHGVGEPGNKTAVISPGIYELRRQLEDTHEGMQQVID